MRRDEGTCRRGLHVAITFVVACVMALGLVPTPALAQMAEEAMGEEPVATANPPMDGSISGGEAPAPLPDEKGRELAVEAEEPVPGDESAYQEPTRQGQPAGEAAIGEQGVTGLANDNALSAQSASATNPRVGSNQVVTWDCVWFGSYPQSEVTSDDDEFASLSSASWDADGNATIGDKRYRRISGAEETPYRYFRYEPIKWRVLNVDGGNALILSDQALDHRSFHGNYWHGYNWSDSHLRIWLNGRKSSDDNRVLGSEQGTFPAVAFTEAERSSVKSSTIENHWGSYNPEDQGETVDGVFLLSRFDVVCDANAMAAVGDVAKNYGFDACTDVSSKNAARTCHPTDYVRAKDSQLSSDEGQSCLWWLRSMEDINYHTVSCIGSDGAATRGYVDDGHAVRPALTLDLSSPCVSFAGTVSSNGEVNETSFDNNQYALQNTPADDFIIERVRLYTLDGQVDLRNRILAENLSNEEKIQKLNDFYSNYGITDIWEGTKYLTELTSHQRAYRYLVNNDIYCAYNWLYWLYNDPVGFVTRSLLYTNGLLFNWEVGDYINPLTYANNRLPGVEKSRTVLKEFLETDDSSPWSEGFSASKSMGKTLSNLATLNGYVQDAELDELMGRILECNPGPELDGLQRQYSEKLLGKIKANGKGDVVLDVPGIAKACSYASDTITFVSATVDDIVAMVNLENDVKKYESHRRFLERVMDDPEVSWEMRTAAASLLDDIDNGYLNRLASIVGNAIEFKNNLMFTDKSMMQCALEEAGVSGATSELLSSAISTLRLGVFVSNIVVDAGYTEKQAAYTQAYAELGASFAWRLEQDKAAFLANQSVENAWTFFEDYTTLWKLRYMGEKQYLELNKVKMFVFGTVPSCDYNFKAEHVKSVQRNLEAFKFDLTGDVVVPEGVQYEQKAVFRCPVDVEVYAPDGTIVATMRDGEESDVTNDHGRFVVVRDSYNGEYAKIACLVGVGEYSFVAKGTDLGLMNVQYGSADLDDVQSVDNLGVTPQTSVRARFDSPTDTLVCEVDSDGDSSYEKVLPGHASAEGDERQPVESIECDPLQLDMVEGEEALLNVTAQPLGSACQDVYWVSLDDKVATVRNGKVTAQGAGSTTVLCVAQGDTELVAKCEISVTTAPIDIAACKVTPAQDVVAYDGTRHEPGVTVTLGDETLVEGRDYALSFENNQDVGMGKVIVEGKGSYTGKASATFRVAFKDVGTSLWSFGVVHRAADLGLFSGYSGERVGCFGPNDKITRGQVAVVLWNMKGGPDPGANAKVFPDVRDGDYFYRAVRWASGAGVVSGYENGYFGPSDNVTREQLAVMLANYARNVGQLQVTGSAADFDSMQDKDKVSSWAVASVGWCFQRSILSGAGGNVLPQGSAARAEASKMMVFLHDLLG